MPSGSLLRCTRDSDGSGHLFNSCPSIYSDFPSVINCRWYCNVQVYPGRQRRQRFASSSLTAQLQPMAVNSQFRPSHTADNAADNFLITVWRRSRKNKIQIYLLYILNRWCAVADGFDIDKTAKKFFYYNPKNLDTSRIRFFGRRPIIWHNGIIYTFLIIIYGRWANCPQYFILDNILAVR